MGKTQSYGLEQARMHLPSIAANAHAGQSTIITKHGKPYAAVVPLSRLKRPVRSRGILPMAGSCAGLWGDDPSETIRELRDEWERNFD